MLAVVIGLLAPLQILESFLSSVSTGSPIWDLMYATLRGVMGLAWALLGHALWSESSTWAQQPSRVR
jgi:hypothetical protein